MSKRRHWTTTDLRVLTEMYPNHSNAEIAQVLRRSVPAVLHRAIKAGLSKTPEHMAAYGGRFHARQVPWNKGARHAPPGSEPTRFKPGNRPHNWKPVGAERINPDGVLERKVADTGVKRTDWRPVKDLVWEAAHGPVPESHIIVCTNRSDIRAETLLCLTRAEHMARLSVHQEPGRASEAQRKRWAKQKATPFSKFIGLHLGQG